MFHCKSGQIRALAFFTTAVVIIASIGVGKRVYAEQLEKPSEFRADFSELNDGIIFTTDDETVESIEKNFYVYNCQKQSKTGESSYFERNEVNGYLVVEDSNPNEPKFPDTGIYPAWDLDGFGNASDKPIPVWSVSDKWLSCSAYSGEDAFLFRQGNLLYLKDDTDSGFAGINNFELDMSFKFSSNAQNDALALIFHARDAGLVTDPYQTLAMFNANGDLFVGRLQSWDSEIVYDDSLKSGADKVKMEANHEYRLSVKVLNSAMTLIIYDGETKLCEYSKSDKLIIGEEAGYMAIGMSNNGVSFADINVRRLDDNGKMVDFSCDTPGYQFGFNAATLCNYRTLYYASNGSEEPQRYWETYYIRNSNDLYWYDFNSARRGNPTWLGDNLSSANERLGKMFDVYHEQISITTGKRLFGKSTSFYDRIGAEINIGEGQVSGQTYLANGMRLLLLEDAPAHKLLSQAITLSPKTEDNEQIITKNFETSFSTVLFKDNEKAIAVSFRSSSPGQMLNDTANGSYTDKVTILLTGQGCKIYDGTRFTVSNNSFTRNKWNNGAEFNGDNANVYIKVVENKLYMKVTGDNGKVYYDKTTTLGVTAAGRPLIRKGYIYYSSLDGYGYFENIMLNRLDENGEISDINSNPDIEIKSVDYETINATIDRAKGESMANVGLPKNIVGTTAEGEKIALPVKWESEDYRSYKDGDFTFNAVSVYESIKFESDLQPIAVIKNSINGDYDTSTSRKYYFDSENDFKDFVCHLTNTDFSGSKTTIPVNMDKVDPLECWAIEGDRAKAVYSRTVNTGWNGINRASDVSTMVLEDENFALINFQIDIDYTHGNGWYPYIIYNIQDSSQFFGDVYIHPTMGNRATGEYTDLHFTDKTKKGGVWSFLEFEGTFNFWGAIKGDKYGRIMYDRDVTEGQKFIETYKPQEQHHMTIKVYDGVVSMKVDDSDVYYAELDDSILGGYAGFAACANYITYDNFMITALNESGETVKLNDAEKGFSPEIKPDTYTGWQPTKAESDFTWDSDYLD